MNIYAGVDVLIKQTWTHLGSEAWTIVLYEFPHFLEFGLKGIRKRKKHIKMHKDWK